LSPDFTQVATNYALSTALTDTTIYTANFADAKFTNKSGVSCENAGTSTSTGNTTPGAKGASELLFVGATTFAALVSALF